MKVGPNSILRGAGAAIACLLPGARSRGLVLAGSYAAAGLVDPTGIQVVAIGAVEDAGPLRARVIPLATATASWVAVQSVATVGLRRLPLPTYVVAAVWGVAVVVADSVIGQAALNHPQPEEPPSSTP